MDSVSFPFSKCFLVVEAYAEVVKFLYLHA